jgi:hypothetical protein
LEQEPYLLWKATLLGDHVSSTYNVVKRDKGKEYYAKWFATHASTHLRPLYDLFYRTGARVFPKSLPELFTPLVLAVWYMDDGNCGGYEPRIAFGLDDKSLDRAVKSLRGLGLKPEVHGEGSNSAFHFPGQADVFFTLVRPHIHPCMAYKVPELTPRQLEDRNARRLTSDTASLLVTGGMTYEQVASVFDVGVSTVRRRVQSVGLPPKRMGRPRHTYNRRAAEVALGNFSPDLWGGLGDTEKTRWVEDILKILRGVGFPYPEVLVGEVALGVLERLSRSASQRVGQEIRPKSYLGVNLCNGYFPNRFQASWRGKRTAFEDWFRDDGLRWAIRFQLDKGSPVVPSRVLRALTMQRRTPTIFRPLVAKYLYQTYCSAGGKVWDPCSGYGGRLLGALAAGVTYLGTDVETATVDGNNRLAEVLGKTHQAKVLEHPAETFDPGEVDMVFTSPPYFGTELYGGSEGQSFRRYPTFDDWLGGFTPCCSHIPQGVARRGVPSSQRV